ncbi:hypothetical protein HNQ87_001050 [Pacificimonas flava]|uniref:Uncharacterized protein n=1 Tax=Pacificimonas flava TaxID=1234595 RepID=M2SFS0_9SPHN|nr:hypothetical protein C725_0150 [Pacificimonas flava]MBB5279903.1 hypothetical protein [Pacificimonas flava]
MPGHSGKLQPARFSAAKMVEQFCSLEAEQLRSLSAQY